MVYPDRRKTQMSNNNKSSKALTFIQRWSIFFFGVSRSIPEYVTAVDLTNGWRSHVVWSKKSGDDLRTVVTGRYTSSTVFLSLLFSTEMAVIYSPSNPANSIRAALAARSIGQVEYWAGLAICLAIFFSAAALLANFTAWSVFSAISKENAPIVLRSDIGVYSAQLPSRLIVMAKYLFFCVVFLTCSIGNVVMYSGAMSDMPILEDEEEEKLKPHELSDILLRRVQLAKKLDVSVMKQYRVDYNELIRDVEEGRITFPIPDAEFDVRASEMLSRRRVCPHVTESILQVVEEDYVL